MQRMRVVFGLHDPRPVNVSGEECQLLPLPGLAYDTAVHRGGRVDGLPG